MPLYTLTLTLSNTLTITCTCTCCYEVICGAQDGKMMCSHANSLILSMLDAAPRPCLFTHSQAHSHSLNITCTGCCDGIYGAQDLKPSHANSLILSMLDVVMRSRNSRSQDGSFSLTDILSPPLTHLLARSSLSVF